MQDKLDTPLFIVAEGKGMSAYTYRNAVEGTVIFGANGSGKTSGTGRMYSRKLLEAGFGGLVLTVKPDEKKEWIRYCKEAGRLDDLIIVEPGGKHAFNFLEYESSDHGDGITLAENISQVLKTVIASSEEKSGGKSDDPFWESALDMLLLNVIDMGLLAKGKVSPKELYDIVSTAPRKQHNEPVGANGHKTSESAFSKAFRLAQEKITSQIDNLLTSLSEEESKELGDQETFEQKIMDQLPDAHTMKLLDQFFAADFRNLSEKTRSIIEISVSNFLSRLLREPVYSLFCKRTSTFTPDDCRKGKIILLNFPVKQYHKVGRDIQVMFKYIWQRAMERRTMTESDRFVFLFADEAQHFLHEHDSMFQATARSAGICTVYLSQNLPNFYSNMGGEKSEYRVKSFLGTLGTKIFHANADIDTNKYASDLIGQGYMKEESNTITVAGKMQAAQGTSYKLAQMVRPEEFVGLRTGGELNGKRVSCFIHRQGNKFHNGFNFIEAVFPQD